MEKTTMATASEGVIEKLGDLAEIVKDSEEGYRTAADGTRDPSTKTLFERYAEQRHQMAEELKQCIRGLGAEPPQSGTMQGRAHRVWTSLKAAVSSDDALAMLEECERGEDVTKREFQEALNANLPVTVRPTVEMMYGRVREAHDQVKALRDKRRADH
jgi:uncharacterized protein (TIGR02284 family)